MPANHSNHRTWCGALNTLVFSALAVCSTRVGAESPQLSITQRSEEPHYAARSLDIVELRIEATLNGAIAVMSVQARFVNPAELAEPAEQVTFGNFALELPERAEVIGYALDVDGELIESVLADQPRRRPSVRYQQRQGMDPQPPARKHPKMFTTPVLLTHGSGGRTVKVTFVAPVSASTGLMLPLAMQARIGQLEIKIRGDNLLTAPQITLPAELFSTYTTQSGTHLLTAHGSNVLLDRALRVAPVQPAAGLLASTHSNGRRLFQLSDRSSPPFTASPGKISRVRIYWDRSASRRDDELTEEIALLRDYLSSMQLGAIDLIAFNSSGAQRQSLSSLTALGRALERIVYRGATSYAVLDGLQLPHAELCLLFSDGSATIDRNDRFAPECPTLAVTSERDARTGYLQHLAMRSGGAVLALSANSRTEVLGQLQGHPTRVVAVSDINGRHLDFAVLEDGPAGWTIVGEQPASDGVIVRFGAPGRPMVERRYDFAAAAQPFEGTGALWAAHAISRLADVDGADAQLRQLSMGFSVASPVTDFAVLETPQNYVAANLEPPRNFPAAAWERYLIAKVNSDQQRAAERNEHLAKVVAAWDERRTWWQKERRSIPKVIAEVLVTASAIGAGSGHSARPVEVLSGDDDRSVRIPPPWRADRPYLNALQRAAAADFSRVYEEQERVHGALPVFYLDVAEWLHDRGRPREALEALLSALELPTHDEATVTIVANRLGRYGEWNRAIWLYEELAATTAGPGPLRRLALALARRATKVAPAQATRDLQRAVELLSRVVNTPWPGYLDGIELIALTEANVLIHRLRNFGVQRTELDSRLITLLDADLRIVLEPYTDTDLSLRVIEPDGAVAFSHNQRTAIGALLTNRATAHNDAAEYLLRRATPGRYSILVEGEGLYGYKPNGNAFATVHVIRDFGRKTQREETLEVEAHSSHYGTVLVGEFVIGN